MSRKKICVFSNETELSLETRELLLKAFAEAGYEVSEKYGEDAELIVCVGGDGAFIKALHLNGFPDIPFLGINTGHLGFFQEFFPDKVTDIIDDYRQGKYRVQKYATVKAEISAKGVKEELPALNEIVIRSYDSYTIHLNISIGDSFIERFSGDGICVASSAGSTGYNYSLRGSIIDPRLKVLQVTPIAPMNTTAYRSFTSSLILPSDLYLRVTPEEGYEKIRVVTDSIDRSYEKVKEIKVKLSEKEVMLLRFENYDFWNKVKTKFL
ncbi:MAG: NAD(+)/NADH kinase [Anaerovoracaceae bacterium]|nr:NAD(+)/NADH kinase [Clostridiales bacterium]